MHITIKAGMEYARSLTRLPCTLLLTRWTHHDSITVWHRLTHRHAINIFWVGHTHQHATVVLWLWSWVLPAHSHWSRDGICTLFDTAAMQNLLTRLPCTLFNTVDPSWQHQSVRPTDTSACMLSTSCELDRHISMLSSSCELDRHISMLSSSCDSEVEFYTHITIKAGMAYARSLTRLPCTLFNKVDPSWQHHSVISTDTSTCYQHLVSWTYTSACYLHLVTLKLSFTSTYARSLTRLPCTLLLTRWTHHDSITVWDRLTHQHACYQHLVSWTDTSACYLHLVTRKLSFTCTSPLTQGWPMHAL